MRQLILNLLLIIFSEVELDVGYQYNNLVHASYHLFFLSTERNATSVRRVGSAAGQHRSRILRTRDHSAFAGSSGVVAKKKKKKLQTASPETPQKNRRKLVRMRAVQKPHEKKSKLASAKKQQMKMKIQQSSKAGSLINISFKINKIVFAPSELWKIFYKYSLYIVYYVYASINICQQNTKLEKSKYIETHLAFIHADRSEIDHWIWYLT